MANPSALSVSNNSVDSSRSPMYNATKTAQLVVFSDINLNVNEDTSLELVYNETSINNSIMTILGTKVGSRVFRRDFGSSVMDLLHDPMDSITTDRLRRELISAIGTWEPRVVLNKAEVLPDFPNQQYFIEISYSIPSLGNKSAVFNFNLSNG